MTEQITCLDFEGSELKSVTRSTPKGQKSCITEC